MAREEAQIAKDMMHDAREFLIRLSWLFLFMVLPASAVAGAVWAIILLLGAK